jgi:hypothetical protein
MANVPEIQGRKSGRAKGPEMREKVKSAKQGKNKAKQGKNKDSDGKNKDSDGKNTEKLGHGPPSPKSLCGMGGLAILGLVFRIFGRVRALFGRVRPFLSEFGH